MDFTLHGLRDRILQARESRIPLLSKWTYPSRLPRGAWIFPLALMLGIWANRGSREEGRLAWLHANPPALETWRAHLLRRGFAPIDDPDWREKAFAEMPDVGRARDSALISVDRATFALRTEGDWSYFKLGGGKAGGAIVRRELWERLGLGWEAVARFDALDLPLFRKPAEKPGNWGEWRDARSLSY